MKSEQISKRVKVGEHTTIRHLNLLDSIKLIISQWQDPQQKIIEEKMTGMKQINSYRAQSREVIYSVVEQIQQGKAISALIAIKLFMLEHFEWVFQNDIKLRDFEYSVEKQKLAVSSENSIYVRIRRKTENEK